MGNAKMVIKSFSWRDRLGYYIFFPQSWHKGMKMSARQHGTTCHKTTIVIFYTMRTSNLTYYGKFPPKIYWTNLYLVHYDRYFTRSSNQTLSVIWKTKAYGTKKCTRPEINVFAKTLSLILCLRTLRKTMDIHCSAHH